MRLLVVGSVAYDTVETPGGRVEEILGGSATFFCTSASYFTRPVRLVAVVGDDFRDEDIAYLEQRDVNLEGLERRKGRTFRWGGRYEANMKDRVSLFTELGVFEDFQPQIPQAHRRCELVFLANIDPVLQLQVLDQMDSPQFVACDTMDFWIDNRMDALRKVLERIDLLVINDEEAQQLSGTSHMLPAAREIQKMGPSNIILKRGDAGAIMFWGTDIFCVPALPLKRIEDPTGAGDSFAGGMMGYLARHENVTQEHLRGAVVAGSVMASFNVEAFSLEKLGNLSHEQIRDRCRAFYALTRFEQLDL